MSNTFETYLEKIGIKYMLGIVTISYVIGTALFNIYLRSLGIYEFNLLQLRYMFVGMVFALITGAFFMLIFGLWRVHFLSKKKKPTKREYKLFWNRIETAILIVVLPWMYIYARFILPEIPSGFGGAKPIVARLIGSPEEIQRINELIAYETNTQPEKLPFEVAPGKTNLAIGANVMILDQSKERLFLLLTKDLYLSSTSRLAKSLKDSGKNIESIATKDTKDFQMKPLIVNASDIVSFTMSLYEPPEVLTRDDIEIAASVIASSTEDEDQKIVSAFLEEKAPEVAPQVLAAVQKKIEEKQTTPQNPTTTTPKPSLPVKTEPTPEEIAQQEKDTEEIAQTLGEFFDTKFLDFRAEIFGQASNLCGYERNKGKDSAARLDMVREISRRFKADFPDAWNNLWPNNYLADGQGEKEFSCNLVKIFQGADNAQIIVNRLNERKVSTGPDFDTIRAEALTRFVKSSQQNTAGDRKYVSQLLVNYFSQSARQMSEYWSDTKYLYEGREDEDYFDNLKVALTEPQSWSEFGVKLQEFFNTMVIEPAEEPVVEEPPVEEPPVEETPPAEEPYTGSGSTVDTTPIETSPEETPSETTTTP